MQINQNLRGLRVLKCIPQKLIADQMGLSQNIYSRLERGKIKMTEEKKIKAAVALGISKECLETFHEKQLFIYSEQQENPESPMENSHKALPMESLEGFRAALVAQKEEIMRLRDDFSACKEENRRLQAEITRLSKLTLNGSAGAHSLGSET